jgi:tetratricopeptide (TPR) repeat protein
MNKIAAFGVFVLLLLSCGNKKTHPPEINPKDSLSTSMNLINDQIKNDPDNPNLLYERSKLFYNQKLVDKALEDINKAIGIDSSKAPFFLHQSDVYYAMNKISEAKTAIEKSLQLDPKSREANAKMGELQYYLKDYANAFKYLDEALRIDPYYAKVYFIKGLCFKENGDTTLAISSFRTCIEQDPDYFHAYMQLGDIMSKQNNPLAIDYYTNAIRVNGSMVEAYYGLGYYYQEHGQPEDAIKVYNDLLKIDPRNAPAQHNIGYTYLFKLNDPGRSISYFTDALLDDQGLVNAYYHRGYAYEKLGKKELAIKDYKKCRALSPDFDLPKERLKKLGVKD